MNLRNCTLFASRFLCIFFFNLHSSKNFQCVLPPPRHTTYTCKHNISSVQREREQQLTTDAVKFAQFPPWISSVEQLLPPVPRQHNEMCVCVCLPCRPEQLERRQPCRIQPARWRVRGRRRKRNRRCRTNQQTVDLLCKQRRACFNGRCNLYYQLIDSTIAMLQ